jgi:hypothetical protein
MTAARRLPITPRSLHLGLPRAADSDNAILSPMSNLGGVVHPGALAPGFPMGTGYPNLGPPPTAGFFALEA